MNVIERILDRIFYQKEEEPTELEHALEHACDRYWRAISREEQQSAVDDIRRLLRRGEL